MNSKKFRQSINMGLGGAIIELKNNQDGNAQHRDAVLRACFYDTRYDAQSEATRHNYLFEAITCFADRAYFEDKIIDRFNRTNGLYLTSQLCNLLTLLAKNGNGNAATALQKKFDALAARLPHITRYGFQSAPRENAEQLAICLMDLYGIKSFFQTAQKFGSILLKTKKEYVLSYDWFLDSAKRKLGKRKILEGLEKKAITSLETRRFLDEIKRDSKKYAELEKTREDKITLQDLLDAAESDKAILFYGYGHRLAKKATAEELAEIAGKIDNTDNPLIKTALLSVFRGVDYPYPVDRLLAIYHAGNDQVKEMALQALGRFKHKQIHALAVYNLRNGLHIIESLWLLKKNFHDEYGLVLNALKSYKNSEEYDYHALTLAIQKIFSTRPNPKAKNILLFDYHKNRCSYCRRHIVEIMCKSNCIPDNILEECLYDCNEDTRKTAARHKKRRQAFNLYPLGR